MARMIHRDDITKPDIMRATVRTWPFPDHEAEEAAQARLGDNPFTATEKMWWRSTSSLAYNVGQQYPQDEASQLIGDAAFQHELRFGPGTEPVPYLGPAGSQHDDDEDRPRRRPRKMRGAE